MLRLASKLDYTNPKGSFTEYIYHDLIVSEVSLHIHSSYFCNDVIYENQHLFFLFISLSLYMKKEFHTLKPWEAMKTPGRNPPFTDP